MKVETVREHTMRNIMNKVIKARQTKTRSFVEFKDGSMLSVHHCHYPHVESPEGGYVSIQDVLWQVSFKKVGWATCCMSLFATREKATVWAMQLLKQA